MDVLYNRCSGLDVHKKTVVASVRLVDAGGVHRETRTFGTMTGDLLELSDWLEGQGVTHVGMESTGVYWKPVYNLLEDSFELILANAKEVKNVPGRKTDVADAAWMAELLAHGLIRPSCVPDRPTRELRELVRYRKSLVRQRTAEVNRVHKVLEGANIKLGSVATDILGKSGRAMLERLVAGETDPTVLAELAKGRLREKLPELAAALRGDMGSHQRFMLRELLDHISHLDQMIDRLEAAIDERMRPVQDDLDRLATTPGIGQRSAQIIAAELPDLSRFPSAKHLTAWAGLAPGNNQSAGKRKHARTTQGNQTLRETLIEVAWAAVHTKDSHLSAKYRRLVVRRGPKRAIVAVARSILVSIYYLLTRGVDYRDLGANHFDARQQAQLTARLVRRLEDLGHSVTLAPAQAAT